jgi:hypothetical protein
MNNQQIITFKTSTGLIPCCSMLLKGCNTLNLMFSENQNIVQKLGPIPVPFNKNEMVQWFHFIREWNELKNDDKKSLEWIQRKMIRKDWILMAWISFYLEESESFSFFCKSITKKSIYDNVFLPSILNSCKDNQQLQSLQLLFNK